MNKDGTLVIDNWYEGQKNHPIAGFGLLQNVEVFENRGLVKLKNALTLDGSITPNELPTAYAKDDYGNEYILTGGYGEGVSKIYKNGTEISGASLSPAHDMVIFKNYVFVRHGEFLSSYGPVDSGGAGWFPGNNGFTTSYKGALLVGQDDFLYVADGNQVLKYEVTAQPAGTQPTLTLSATLNIKDGQYASCLEELGTDIAVGTHTGGSYVDRGNNNGARIYFWNRQAGTLGNPGLADLPIIIDENGINAIKQRGNRLYISAGTRGNIYVSDSTNYAFLTQLPYTKQGINAESKVLLNAMDFSQSGTLLVGLSCERSESTRPGVYEVDIKDSNNPVSLITPSSTSGVYGAIGLIENLTYNRIKVGWRDSSTVGLDVTDSTLVTGYGGVIQTRLFKVGKANNKKTFQHIEWTLAEPLSTGQAIRISYRSDVTSDWTTIGTWDFATLGAITDYEATAGISDVTYLQLQIELEDDDSASTNLNLIALTLY